MLSGLGPRRVLPSIILPFFISTARWVSEVVPSRLPADLETLILDQYRNGKFCDLLCSAIAKPSFLLAACRNLSPDGSSTSLDSISRRISINDLGRELRVGSFDVESSCAKLLPSRKKGAPLILPSLKLKVVIEAVRMALDIVYEKRFATFAYGGRSGMGRHTAVRYLKDAVLNPSWWFHVVFIKQTVDFQRLKILLAEKIEDDALIGIIERLFLSGAMSVEVGGLDMGRGFPQESNLNAVLVNIYLSGLDKEIQDIRSLVHRSHPRCKELEREQDSMVFHKPVRVYAVRYLDELLIVTSGSKLLTMDIKDRILTYVEDNMGMKVDKLQTSIHSAVSEKMDFLGLELQAVPPSILHPPMSEKAMRARKKYLKQKLAKALELKNARETRRKKLGMKILKHVFKKLKRVGEFKIDFPIESEVREVFRTWGGEVVVEYMKSREDCRDWHRMLTSGDFLSLKRVRDLLPGSLVEAYDQFQENVDKYFMSNRVNNQIGGKEKDEVEEGRRYAKRTVEDLTKLFMRVNAPIELVRRAVKLAGFTNSMGRPRPIKLLLGLDDSDIIKWYAGVGWRWLNFFCCCHNFKMVKTIVNYHLRFSCFLTLAEKHESTKHQAIQHYSKDLQSINSVGLEEIYFATEREINSMGDRKLSDPKPVDGAISMILVRLAFDDHSSLCMAHFCESKDTILYRVRLLQNRLNVDPQKEEKWVPRMGAIHEAFNKKCLALCPKHATNLLLGKIYLQDIDCTSFLNID